MSQAALTGAPARARREAQASLYRPRSRPATSAAAMQEDPRLLHLTREVLEQLKHPAAIPSRVVMQALKQAAALPR